MATVEFIDTSVLVEVLNIPGRNSNHRLVLKQLKQKLAEGVQLVLPVATIIETGNHITHINEGSARRKCAQAFANLLELCAANQAPWVLHSASWDGAMLSSLCTGARTKMTLVQHAESRMLGSGDLSILAERDRYRERVSKGTVVRVWTQEQVMNQWAS